ncbi:hypothetical protein BDZ90DRAFT_259368 [Jaminaea rosea]|uniref:Uncharacterized protein n=1 Tax=Jaminaea rosea TaxID=1569628 RepID=A0A316UU42_9BASI|nr:hypothetical protein BDZ90DRAFT_259368 [Jaminaea rosea]PWN28318.1 hypothetical protein BDZ90DRAFT_259368 [Jaminaea rosea]
MSGNLKGAELQASLARSIAILQQEVTVVSSSSAVLPTLRCIRDILSCDGEGASIHVEVALDEHFFHLFAALAPFLPSSHDKIRSTAISCLQTLRRKASPREMTMAIQEQLDRLGKCDQDQEEEEELCRQSPAIRPGRDAAMAATTLLTLLSEVLLDVQAKRPAAFFRPLVYTATQSLRATRGCTAAASDELLEAVALLGEKAENWMSRLHYAAPVTPAEEGKDLVIALFLASFAELGPRTTAAADSMAGEETPAEGHFLDQRPAYRRNPSTISPSQLRARQARPGHAWLREVLSRNVLPLGLSFKDIALGTAEVPKRKGDDDEDDDDDEDAVALRTASRVGAWLLTVLDYVDPCKPGNVVEDTGDEVLALLRRSMPFLLVALQQSALQPSSDSPQNDGNDAVSAVDPSFFMADHALLFLQLLLDSFRRLSKRDSPSRSKHPLPYHTTLLPLTRLLSTHAALCPFPVHRQIGWTMLKEELKELMDSQGQDDEETVLDLLRDLLTESPFAQLRAASVGLGRELFAERLRLGMPRDGKKSGIVSNWRALFTQCIFVLPEGSGPKVSEDSDEEQKAQQMPVLAAYIDSQAPWLLEALNVAYYLLLRSGSASEEAKAARAVVDIAALQANLVRPLRERMELLATGKGLRTEGQSEARQSDLIEVVLGQMEERLQRIEKDQTHVPV